LSASRPDFAANVDDDIAQPAGGTIAGSP